MESEAASHGVDDPCSSSSSHSPNVTKVEKEYLRHIDEETTYLEPSGKCTNLTLQIPSRPINLGNNQPQGFPIASSSTKGFTRGLSFKNKTVILDGERSSLLNSNLASSPDGRAGPESAILANFAAALSWKRCLSLPSAPASNLSPSSASTKEKTQIEPQSSQKKATSSIVSRSLSVPMRNVIIVRSGSLPRSQDITPVDPQEGQISPEYVEGDDEEIPEEDAVCRICFIGLTEGGSWLKMECSCKGDLRLLHEQCALKWFSIKGDKRCDVCGQEVRNLPVILFRMQSSAQRDSVRQRPRQSSNTLLNRNWPDMVVLLLISTVCYFFFLEQLLVDDLKSHAVMIAAPFSLTLGLLGSVSSIVLASREYIWAYSAFQFALVAIFLHLFYSVIEISAVFAILFASFAGFGLAMGVNSCSIQFLAWRARLAEARANANLA